MRFSDAAIPEMSPADDRRRSGNAISFAVFWLNRFFIYTLTVDGLNCISNLAGRMVKPGPCPCNSVG